MIKAGKIGVESTFGALLILMIKKWLCVVCLAILLGATSCNRISFTPFPQNGQPVELTKTGTVEPALPTETAPAPDATATVTPPDVVEANTPVPLTDTATAVLPCDAAAAGHPIDVTIPDDTVLPPGASFTKVWRLVNAGSCAWTRDYAVVWFSGDQLSSSLVQNLPHEVQSGQSVDISVDMIAPEETGVRQSYWKLRNADSELFGIGPAGDAPFWVRIIVEDAAAPASTVTPTSTATSVSLLQGSVDLLVGEGLDLDSGEKVEADLGDLSLEQDGGQLAMKPAAGALLGLAGFDSPSQANCRQTAQGTEPQMVTDAQIGAYYCYQTDLGLPGVARLMSVSLEGIRLDYLTWAIP